MTHSTKSFWHFQKEFSTEASFKSRDTKGTRESSFLFKKMKEQCLLWVTQAGMHQIGWPACNYTTFNMLVFPETLRSIRRSRRKTFFFLSEKKKKGMNWDLNIIYRNSLCIMLKGFLHHKARFLLHNDQWPRDEHIQSACQSPWQMNHDRIF